MHAAHEVGRGRQGQMLLYAHVQRSRGMCTCRCRCWCRLLRVVRRVGWLLRQFLLVTKQRLLLVEQLLLPPLKRQRHVMPSGVSLLVRLAVAGGGNTCAMRVVRVVGRSRDVDMSLGGSNVELRHGT